MHSIHNLNERIVTAKRALKGLGATGIAGGLAYSHRDNLGEFGKDLDKAGEKVKQSEFGQGVSDLGKSIKQSDTVTKAKEGLSNFKSEVKAFGQKADDTYVKTRDSIVGKTSSPETGSTGSLTVGKAAIPAALAAGLGGLALARYLRRRKRKAEKKDD